MPMDMNTVEIKYEQPANYRHVSEQHKELSAIYQKMLNDYDAGKPIKVSEKNLRTLTDILNQHIEKTKPKGLDPNLELDPNKPYPGRVVN